MSARDIFVVDEEHDARVREEYAPWKAATGNDAAELSAPESKGLAYVDQVGDQAMLPFLLRHIWPLLIIALLVMVAMATGDSASVSDIPTPCRG